MADIVTYPLARILLSAYGTKRNRLGTQGISGAEGRPARTINLAGTLGRGARPSAAAR